MPNTQAGEALLATRRVAEEALKKLNPKRYETLEQWYDRELYGGLYGHGGVEKLPASHLPQIRQVLRARAAVYRGRRRGDVVYDGGDTFGAEIGNEKMAQAIDACLVALGEGPTLPPDGGHTWHDFWPMASGPMKS
jgi:hypothetical protein